MSLEAITVAAVEAARESGALPPAEPETSTPESTPVEPSVDAAPDAESGAAAIAAPDGAATAERKWPESFDADTIKILEEHGYRPPVKDNRMPYSKALLQIGAGLKKARTKWDADAAKTAEELKVAREKAEALDRLTQRVNTDAEGFMAWLASQRGDLYGRYVTAARDGAKTPDAQKTETQLARDADPMPEPDITYEDGSKGFKPETWAKREQWLIREGKRQAQEELDKRLRPIEEERANARVHASLVQTVTSQQDKMRKRWGKLFDDHRDAIATAMAKDAASAPITGYTKSGAPLKRLTPFEDICYDVLMPLKEAALATDHNAVRAQVLAELKKAPEAASPRSTVARTTVVEDDAPLSMEDVTRRALRQQGLIK